MNRCAFVVLCCVTASLAAQQPAAPGFEVASVKVNNSRETDYVFVLGPPGRVLITNAPLRGIVLQAFEIQPQLARYALVGGPERIMTTRFDINAKPPEDALPAQTRARIRTLLTERFNLKTHTETRDIPVYALKIATAGRFGSGFRASTHDCAAFMKSFRPGPALPEPTDANGTSWCRANPFGADGMVLHRAGPIADLISRDLQGFMDRPIVDMTGLSGLFEWEGKFRPTSGGAGVPIDSPVPDVFTALREQLGLKLEPQTAPYEVLVIDQVTMPTPD